MLRIRLTRVGKKNTPVYRVVVADQRKAVKRKFIEILGYYHPAATPKQLVIDKEKALGWIKQGAQATDTVNNLMCDLGILPKNEKVKTVYGKKTKKKDEGKEAAEPKAEAKAEEAAQETASEEVSEEKPAEETEAALEEQAPESEEPEIATAEDQPAEEEKAE